MRLARDRRSRSWFPSFVFRCVDKKFTVAVAARDRAVVPALHAQTQCRTAVAQAFLDDGVERRIRDDSALAYLPRLQFELRLDQHQRRATGLEQGHQRRQDQGERNERQVAGDQVEVVAHLLRRELTRIDAFDRDYARIAPHFLVQLTMADVHSGHPCSAVLEQAVGEPTGGLPDVQADLAGHVDSAGRQRAFELQATARNVTRFGAVQQLHLRLWRQLLAILDDALPRTAVEPAHARGDQALGLRARGRKATFDEKLVGTQLNTGTYRPCTGPASARRCTRPARRSAP